MCISYSISFWQWLHKNNKTKVLVKVTYSFVEGYKCKSINDFSSHTYKSYREQQLPVNHGEKKTNKTQILVIWLLFFFFLAISMLKKKSVNQLHWFRYKTKKPEFMAAFITIIIYIYTHTTENTNTIKKIKTSLIF